MEAPKEESVHHLSVDLKGRPCKPNKHGGMKAAVFVLGLEAFEMMAIAGVGNNLITYVFNEMHFPLSKSANTVTNFVGTVFLLSLLGGFLSDSYLGSFWTMLIFGFVELSGFILLSIQAHVGELRPPKCSMQTEMQAGGGEGVYCEEAKGYKVWIFYGALYLVALGSGCLKPNIISHGADQFNSDGNTGNRRLSTFFNCAYFAFCTGELLALTLLVWVQTHSGMDIGFGVSAAAMALGLICLISGSLRYTNTPPRGSIFTPIAQVFVAAISKRKQVCPSTTEKKVISVNPQRLSSDPSSLSNVTFIHTDKFRFLDKACIKIEQDHHDQVVEAEEGRKNNNNKMIMSRWRVCSVSQVAQVKMLLSLVPIFGCTIIFNTVLAQLQTFSVQQGTYMDTRINIKNVFGGDRIQFRIPPASLQSIPYIMLIFLVPLYETAFVPLARRITRTDSGISPLQRVGIGLFIATFSMVSAAIVEHRRRRIQQGPMSIFWIAPQFLIFGLSEMFTAVGLIEFFYKQSQFLLLLQDRNQAVDHHPNAGSSSPAPSMHMQSFLTALTYCSYSFGFYLSSLLVSLVNKITSSTTTSGTDGWLSDNDLNKDRLDLFYWLLAALSLANFCNYLFWSRWYSCTTANNPSNYIL